MKKSNKIFNIIATVLQILLLVGAYLVNYFTHKKMGMLRYIVYKNNLLENKYPIMKLQYITIAIFAILVVLILALYIKRKLQMSKYALSMNIFMVILFAIYAGFTLINSTETLRAYYYIGFMLEVTVFIQIIKTGIEVLIYKTNKNTLI
ncbi:MULTISPECIES: hypothetical protein [unclassified Romboutsia]|uniref:hypothetical protein n=1 Tax=unclassified Romboutsia TaxID=2626894 RepID=UPI000822B9D9|nr:MULTISPECIES: hypothetical protein [unclassified Romboutsia]SCH87410.1 Uncharacterised protein [uncultured Clostridium sp.]